MKASSIKHQASSIKHQASSIKHQASSIKHQARARPLASVVQFNLVAAALLFGAAESALAQSCAGGTCPDIQVFGIRLYASGGFGGSGYATWDSSLQDFFFYSGPGEEVPAPRIGLPETCAAFQTEFEARSCNQHPYQQPNGCGAAGGWLTSLLNIAIPEDYLGGGGVNFNTACSKHDMCYGNPGYDRYRCDADFGTELANQCRSGTGGWRADAMDFGYSGNQLTNYITEQLYQCKSQGTIMQGAVGQFGAPAFEAAQAVGACYEIKNQAQKLGCVIN